MTEALAAIVVAGIVLPHALPLSRVAPVTAIALWLSSLALRALAVTLAVVYALLYAPATSTFDVLTHWCGDAYVPLLAGEHGLEGHSVGDLVVLIPALLLTLSLVWVSVRVVRATRAAKLMVERDALGPGPGGSVIVGGPEVLFAVAGIARPRVVVSAGALTSLDDEELGAALEHERAHIERRHRFLMLLGMTFRAAGRPVPGSGRAVRELAFHLERDADRCTLARRHDRFALASVICKAAGGERDLGSVAFAGLGQSGVRRRVAQLLEDDVKPPRRSAAATLNGLATAMVACALLLAAIVPAAAVAGVERDAHLTHHGHHCEH